MPVNSAIHAIESSATVTISEMINSHVLIVSINAEAVKLVYASPPFATYMMPTTDAATHGINRLY